MILNDMMIMTNMVTMPNNEFLMVNKLLAPWAPLFVKSRITFIHILYYFYGIYRVVAYDMIPA